MLTFKTFENGEFIKIYDDDRVIYSNKVAYHRADAGDFLWIELVSDTALVRLIKSFKTLKYPINIVVGLNSPHSEETWHSMVKIPYIKRKESN